MSRTVLLLATLAACGATRGASEPAPTPPSVTHVGEARGPIGGEVEHDRNAVAPVVIRTASVGLAVDAYEPMRDELAQWLGSHGGRIADETLARTDGRASWASVEVRLPSGALDSLLAWLQQEHAVERLEVRSEDVTAEWVDLDARLGAMRATEARLLALLGERTASLADVLAAETELARVRGEIESLEGRRRLLADQADLATVRIDVAVRTPYVAAVSVPLGAQAWRAFTGSVEVMGMVARGGLLAGAAALPWLALLGAGGALAFGLVRRLARAPRRIVA